MNTQYNTVRVTCPPDWVDVLIAELSGYDYDSFLETEQGFETYQEAEAFNEAVLRQVLDKYRSQATISYTLQMVEEQNWNEVWEKNFEPIVVEGQCLVRATFHTTAQPYPYEIIVNPKMSFGTGHHATTYLMLRQQLEIDHQGKRVMDAGCGTGILSMMAMKRGSSYVLAFDTDEWAVNNSQENFEMNDCQAINLFQGTVVSIIDTEPFDLILANINRNVLLEEMPRYAQHLSASGQLLLSGFYEEDVPAITQAATTQGLMLANQQVRDAWACLLFEAGSAKQQ